MTKMQFQNDSEQWFASADPDLRARATPTLDLLAPGFFVSWFRPQSTRVWYAALKPKGWVRDRFGLLYEYLLIANHYDRDFHIRTLEPDVDMRVGYRLDRSLVFVASDANGADHICATWARDRGASVVLLTAEGERATSPGEGDAGLEALLSRALRVRDRFDNSEPVRTPGEFFGREALVNDIVQRLYEGHPVGVMGLRKVGKSSVLRRVEDRMLGLGDAMAVTAFVSCNGSDIKGSHWSHLARRLVNDWGASLTRVAGALQRPVSLNRVRAVSEVVQRGSRITDTGEVARALNTDFNRLFRAAANLAGSSDAVRFVAFLDEADHLHPEAGDAPGWTDGFFEFWDTMQALKRGHAHPRALGWMLGGVNPHILEAGSFRGRPNPLFETSVEYLQQMTAAEADEMLNGLGRPMGLSFSPQAVNEAFTFTGGHPWLLRRVGSMVHREFPTRTGPVTVDEGRVRRVLAGNKAKFLNNVEWMLTHLKSIAPDEYALLEDLCVRGPTVYEEDWADREFRDVFAHHLRDYGLLAFDEEVPRVAMPLVAETFRKRATAGFSEQRRRLRDAVDGLEAAIRARLRNDLQYPVVPEPAAADDNGEGGPQWRELEEVVDLVASAIPKEAKNRPKSRAELVELGRTKGLAALFDALNWEDYLVLIEKHHGSLRLRGLVQGGASFVAGLREVVAFAHVVRHNNDTELQEAIRLRGFGKCMEVVMTAQGYFTD